MVEEFSLPVVIPLSPKERSQDNKHSPLLFENPPRSQMVKKELIDVAQTGQLSQVWSRVQKGRELVWTAKRKIPAGLLS